MKTPKRRTIATTLSIAICLSAQVALYYIVPSTGFGYFLFCFVTGWSIVGTIGYISSFSNGLACVVAALFAIVSGVILWSQLQREYSQLIASLFILNLIWTLMTYKFWESELPPG